MVTDAKQGGSTIIFDATVRGSLIRWRPQHHAQRWRSGRNYCRGPNRRERGGKDAYICSAAEKRATSKFTERRAGYPLRRQEAPFSADVLTDR